MSDTPAVATGHKTITLVSGDNEQFQVDRKAAIQSKLIKNMIEDVGESDEAIPLPNVEAAPLRKVVEWCEHHKDDPASIFDNEESSGGVRNIEISTWDAQFYQVDQGLMFQVISAANYLDIKPLLDIGCKTVAQMIIGKTTEEIRAMFGIECDFTPEELAQIKEENAWAEER